MFKLAILFVAALVALATADQRSVVRWPFIVNTLNGTGSPGFQVDPIMPAGQIALSFMAASTGSRSDMLIGNISSTEDPTRFFTLSFRITEQLIKLDSLSLLISLDNETVPTRFMISASNHSSTGDGAVINQTVVVIPPSNNASNDIPIPLGISAKFGENISITIVPSFGNPDELVSGTLVTGISIYGCLVAGECTVSGGDGSNTSCPVASACASCAAGWSGDTCATESPVTNVTCPEGKVEKEGFCVWNQCSNPFNKHTNYQNPNASLCGPDNSCQCYSDIEGGNVCTKDTSQQTFCMDCQSDADCASINGTCITNIFGCTGQMSKSCVPRNASCNAPAAAPMRRR